MPKKFAPVIPLLFGAFVLTSIVALRGSNRVLGESTENLLNDGTEIRDVKVEKINTNRDIQIKNEDGKMRVRVENKIRELNPVDSALKLRVKESTRSGEKNSQEKEVEVSSGEDNELEIQDQEHDVRTNFPITINQEDDTISVTTPKGDVKVKTLPSSAIENLVNNHVFSDVNDVTIEKGDDASQSAVIKLAGQNKYKFLGILPVTANVNAEIDPTTGDVTKLSTPWFINTFGFLFSK